MLGTVAELVRVRVLAPNESRSVRCPKSHDFGYGCVVQLGSIRFTPTPPIPYNSASLRDPRKDFYLAPSGERCCGWRFDQLLEESNHPHLSPLGRGRREAAGEGAFFSLPATVAISRNQPAYFGRPYFSASRSAFKNRSISSAVL
jgi:hypothetical protein